MADTTAEDMQILDQLAGEDGWAQVGWDASGRTFEQVGGRRGRRRRKKRRQRRAKRKGFDSIKSMRKARRRKIGKGIKKIANNKIVRAISKTVLSAVPGGQAIVGISTAARLAAKGVKKIKSAAKRGDKAAGAGLALAAAAKRGDRKAFETLKIAASGRASTLPVPPQLRGFASMLGAEGGTYRVTGPSGRTYSYGADEL